MHERGVIVVGNLANVLMPARHLQHFHSPPKKKAREDKSLLGADLFLEVQKICFRHIFEGTFLELKKNHAERSENTLGFLADITARTAGLPCLG